MTDFAKTWRGCPLFGSIQIEIQIQIILLHYNVLHGQNEFDPSHGTPTPSPKGNPMHDYM